MYTKTEYMYNRSINKKSFVNVNGCVQQVSVHTSRCIANTIASKVVVDSVASRACVAQLMMSTWSEVLFSIWLK